MWISYRAEKCIRLKEFYSLFQVGYGSGYFFPGETHDFWEIVFVREGDVCVSADERIFHLTKGDVIFHKPMEFHKFHIENGKPAVLFIMSFSAEGLWMHMFEERVLRLLPKQEQELSRMISFLAEECGLSGQCDNLALVEMEREPEKFQTFTCMTELLLLSLAKDSDTVRAATDTPEAVAYRNAVQTMEKRIGEWISVPEIAEECNVSVSYLKKIFAKYAGLGVHQYFLKTKMIYASRMLKDGKSVAETAAALSFSSPNYFSTAYKRETGLSPFLYQKYDR